MTHDEKMDYLKTIQDRNKALIQRLNDMVRDTPISDSFSLLGQLLVDQGLADTRAGAIDTAVRSVSNPNYSELRSAILNCDSSNFPLLIYIAPRLILISLQTSVDVALIERTEDAFEKLDRRAS